MLSPLPPTRPSGSVILGLDPGLARLGFGAVTTDARGELMPLRFGVVSTPAGEPTPQRLAMLAQAVAKLLDEFAPDAIAIERLYFSTNVKTAMAVSEARGVVLHALHAAHLPIYEFTPMQVKQTVTNAGRADKRAVQLMVKTLLHLTAIPQPDDAADALAIAICGQRAHARSRFEL